MKQKSLKTKKKKNERKELENEEEKRKEESQKKKIKKDKEQITYSKRRERNPSPPEKGQSSTLKTKSNTQVNLTPKPLFEDLDLPITLRKSSQSYTYLVAKFVSYSALNGSFKAFTTNMSHISIPRDVHEALHVPKW